MPKLYALLVGIDQYHPDSRVRNLHGCVNDVQVMQSFLQQYYHPLIETAHQITCLLNEQASRENVINTFGSHLGQAGPDDFVLFYYSGHGSHEPTSDAFKAGDALGQNETLVCYDSRLPQGYDLADKELAVLISRLNSDAQKIIILDSCHSGSATRSSEEERLGRKRQIPATRFTGGIKQARTLSEYMLPGDGHYQKQFDAEGKVTVPEARHIVLSACNRDETALETLSGRGLFSTHLIKVLEEFKTNISYDNLFIQIQSSVRKARGEQTPQVGPVGGFDTRLSFLGKAPVEKETHFVQWNSQSNQWEMSFGAAHGLPTEPLDIKKLKLKLFPNVESTTGDTGLEAEVKQVSFDKSRLDFPEGDKTQNYKAEITGFPRQLKLWVYLNGSATETQQFLDFYEKRKSAYLLFMNDPAGCSYELLVKGGHLLVYHRASGLLVQGVDEFSDWGIKKIVEVLTHIERWERIKRIHKEATALEVGQVQFTAQQVEATGREVEHEFAGEKITLDLIQSNGSWGNRKLRIAIQNKTRQDLYVQALYMSRFYQVMVANGEKELPKGSGEVDLFNYGLTINDPNITQVVDVIKVIVSTEPLNAAIFNQDKLELGKIQSRTRFMEGASPAWDAVAGSVDWFTQTFHVTIAGIVAKLGPASYTIDQLTFSAHPEWRANLGFASLHAHFHNANAINALPEKLTGSNYEILKFPAGTKEERSVIVFNNIENERSLQQSPLQLEVGGIPPGNTVLPLTYDGNHLIPFGEVRRSGEKVIISFTGLPVEQDLQRVGAPQSLEFVLVKTPKAAQEKRGLHWVDHEQAQKDNRKKEGLAEKIASAKKVLLLLPGLTEDTLEMVSATDFAQAEYDLTLTYDFPDPAASVEQLAESLARALDQVGLFQSDRAVNLVAQGTGGLVGWYLQHIQYQQKVFDQMLLVGVPMAGTDLGALSAAKSFLLQALAFALNYRPGKAGDILALYNQLNEKDDVGAIQSLADSDRNSAVLQMLKEATPSDAAIVRFNGQLKEPASNADQVLLLELKNKMEQLTGESPLPVIEQPAANVYYFNYFNNQDAIAWLRQNL